MLLGESNERKTPIKNWRPKKKISKEFNECELKTLNVNFLLLDNWTVDQEYEGRSSSISGTI